MKEFILDKRFCKITLFLYSMGLLLIFYMIMYFFPKNINLNDILFELFLIVISILVVIYIFPEIVFIYRFYGIKLKALDNALVFCTGTEEYKIELTKDVYSMWCIMGYLIIWPSGKEHNILLLRESLIKVGNFSKFELYLKSKTNFLSSAKEKKEILKLFGINVLNPLRYIKLPS